MKKHLVSTSRHKLIVAVTAGANAGENSENESGSRDEGNISGEDDSSGSVGENSEDDISEDEDAEEKRYTFPSKPWKPQFWWKNDRNVRCVEDVEKYRARCCLFPVTFSSP